MLTEKLILEKPFCFDNFEIFENNFYCNSKRLYDKIRCWQKHDILVDFRYKISKHFSKFV